MYILPLGIILVAFYVIPIIMSIYFSFTKYNIISPATFIGLENYKKLFTDETLKVSIINTIKFTVVVVPCQTILSLILAVWITGKGNSKIASFAKGAIFIPVLSFYGFDRYGMEGFIEWRRFYYISGIRCLWNRII